MGPAFGLQGGLDQISSHLLNDHVVDQRDDSYAQRLPSRRLKQVHQHLHSTQLQEVALGVGEVTQQRGNSKQSLKQ